MINLKYRIEGNKLIVSPYDYEDRQALIELRDEDPTAFGSDDKMFDVFESLICNSELDWTNPTDHEAPMLGILDSDDLVAIKRWAFLNYELRSPLDDLVNGEAVFVEIK